MNKTTTLNEKGESQMPRNGTVKFILNYSKAYCHLKTVNGIELEYLQN